MSGRCAILGMVAGTCFGVLFCSCEYMGDTASANSDVSGTWSYSDSKGSQSTWALVQNSEGAILGTGTEGERITGSMNGESVSMTVTNSGVRSILTGTASVDTMTGHYTNTVYGVGSWTAVKKD
jgi:hypothetical protein